MSRQIEEDRTSQFVVASDSGLTYDEARARLERASLYLSVADPSLEWAQAALLTIAASGVRMFRGGVFFDGSMTAPLKVGCRCRTSLAHAMEDAGCRTELPPNDALHIHIGSAVVSGSPQLYCWADGWVANTAPNPSTNPTTESNVLAGVLAGAVAVADAFRRSVLNDALACRRRQRFDLWPDAKTSKIKCLPTALWLIGLGNLGQAALFVLDLLPFPDTAAVTLFLQDDDTAGRENLAVQVLTTDRWVGEKKTRSAARWAEDRGFQTRICERRFAEGDKPRGEEPRIAIVGVDNLDARRAVASAGFELLIDAGLGATGPEAFDVRVHCFPGLRDAKAAWPEPEHQREGALPGAYRKLLEEGRLDQCGAVTIAGQSVGVPCTALAAASMQLAQVCRAISDGVYTDLADVSFRDTSRAVVSHFANPHAQMLPSARCD